MSAITNDERQFSHVSEKPGRLKGREAIDRITIEAPPELVWDFVADFQGWASWNPLYTKTSGTSEIGETIRFAVHLQGLKPQKGKALVIGVRPNEALEYRLSRMGGLVKAHRYVEIEELSPTRCRVVNGEILGGPFGGLVARAVGPKVAVGLRGMNEALKQVAERKWRSQPI